MQLLNGLYVFFFKNPECRLSEIEQESKMKRGEVPLPITTGIRVRKDLPAETFSGKCDVNLIT